jgi:trans-aconitate 2-methyltransferase
MTNPMMSDRGPDGPGQGRAGDSAAWDVRQYLAFGAERTQPAIDLASRVLLDHPGLVVDLGCGPGNSTDVVRRRWPGARVVGVDHSPEMIAQARAGRPDGHWVLSDARAFDPGAEVDVLFSNAALQWMADHERLLGRLFGFLAPGGALAVQVPANQHSPFHVALREVAASERWRRETAGCERIVHYYGASDYYRWLAPLARRVALWETTYYHVLASPDEIIAWSRSTALRPYLKRLADDAARAAFEREVFEACRASYPAEPDGRALFPFRRVFFVAYRP